MMLTTACQYEAVSLRCLLLIFVCSCAVAAFQSPLPNSQRPSFYIEAVTQKDTNSNAGENNSVLTRREAIGASVAATFAVTALPPPAMAAESYPISASWKAVDGLNSVADEMVAFDASAYRAMKDDPSRTPRFAKALEQRIGEIGLTGQERITVLDLGTGPFALFAIAAAEAGADKVYAIEANAQAATLARQTVARTGYAKVITIIEGLSTDVQLPEQVDICVAEIVGSIASEEGAYGTIYDAHRFVKQPEEPLSWIPNRIQTYAAPASYTLHNLFREGFDWSKLNGEPVRFNCRDYGLCLMAEPVLVEDFQFAEAKKNKPFVAQPDLSFSLDGNRLAANEADFLGEFKRGEVEDAEALAKTTAHSLSGIAFWPRLVLNNDITINSRKYPGGGHQRSHWQTVLPIMADAPVGPVKGGDQVKAKLAFDLPRKVDKPPSYSVTGEVIIA